MGRKRTYDLADERIHRLWQDVLRRAHQSKRGVCDEWRDYETFRKWVEWNRQIGEGTFEGGIRLIDGAKCYGPDNCKLTPPRRRTLLYDGERKTIAEWSKIYGISEWTIRKRIARGDDDRKALRPVGHKEEK